MKYKDPTPGVGIVIFNKSGNILLIQRNGKRAGGKGLWSPPGGFINHGEHFFDAAKRETKEEVGLKIKNLKVLAVTDDQYNKKKHCITIWVKSNNFSGKIKADKEEVANVMWCYPKNLIKGMYLPFQNLIKTDEWKEELQKFKNSTN